MLLSLADVLAPPYDMALVARDNGSTSTSSGGGLGGHVNTTTLFSDNQVLAMQLTCAILAGISLLLGLIICYWLARMKKVFRHRLIFLLMLADMLRSAWLFVFPVVSLARGGVSSRSAFCQASGFFSNASYDMADWIVLAIAINTALQVFQPPANRGQGGLYPYRYIVYTIVLVIPVLLSALAFVDNASVGAYLSQGPTCSLPIRPFWYRLALSWIPRYVIILIVLGLYIAIYVHAERSFVETRPFHRKLSAAVFVYPSERSSKFLRSVEWRPWRWAKARRGMIQRKTAMNRGNASLQIDTARSGAKIPAGPTTSSTFRTLSDYTMVDSPTRSPPTPPLFKGRGGSEATAGFREDIESQYQSRGDSDVTDTTLVASPTTPLPLLNLPSSPLHIQQEQEQEQQMTLAPSTSNASDAISRAQRRKHRTIRRQLRLQFVYPMIYFASWIAPFASHLSMYSSSVARRPIFPLVIIGFASLALMGIVDFAVFSVRERPWRHIPGSDGTILGSFVFWRSMEKQQKTRRDLRRVDESSSGAAAEHTDATLSSLESGGESGAVSRRPSAVLRGNFMHGHGLQGKTSGAGASGTLGTSHVPSLCSPAALQGAGAGGHASGEGGTSVGFGSTLQTIPSIDDMGAEGD